MESPDTLRRLFRESTTAPGSPSKFFPLPTEAAPFLFGRGNLSVYFLAMTVDIHSSDPISAASGLTRLKITSVDTGEEVHLRGIRAPIRFTATAAPLPSSSADAFKDSCVFFNETNGAYESEGCQAAPNPAPPNHTIFWPPTGITAQTGLELASQWQMRGEGLWDPKRCSRLTLDCRAEAAAVRAGKKPRRIFLDASNPFAYPSVQCPDGDNSRCGRAVACCAPLLS